MIIYPLKIIVSSCSYIIKSKFAIIYIFLSENSNLLISFFFLPVNLQPLCLSSALIRAKLIFREHYKLFTVLSDNKTGLIPVAINDILHCKCVR